MLSTDIQQKAIIERIDRIVTVLMEERPLFKEELDPATMIQKLAKLFQENLSFQEFNTTSDEELKKH